MTDNYNPTQSKVWSSALNVSNKIQKLTSHYTDEELQPLADVFKKAQSLQHQLEAEIGEEDGYKKTVSGYEKSLNLIRSMEEDLILAFDQGCITERELKITLEAISIHIHDIKAHQNKGRANHKLFQHLHPVSKTVAE